MKKTFSNFRNKAEISFYKKHRKKCDTKITLSMVVKNEASNFLSDVIKSVKSIISNAVIIDDCSTDNTVEVCESLLADIPHKIYVNKKSQFNTEYKLRTKQFKLTCKEKPDWILVLDADEIFTIINKDKFLEDLKSTDYDLLKFTLFDMWDTENFRSDEIWNGHTRPWPFMLRYQPKFKHFYRWRKTNQHCGRFPANINYYGKYTKSAYVKHLGWSTIERRRAKYIRYKKLDNLNEKKYLLQYESICDENPNLINLEEYIKNNL